MLRTVVATYRHPIRLAQQPILTRRAIYRFYRKAGVHGVDAAFVSLADYYATWGSTLPVLEWQRLAETVAHLWRAYYEQRASVIDPSLLLSGNDLIVLDVARGPRIGELLERIREAQAAGEIETRQEALTRVQKWLARDTP